MLQLPFIKCTHCGKSTLEDEYFISGCPACGHRDGINYTDYKRRSYLADYEGVNVFRGKFRKVGNLHFKHGKIYALIDDIECGTKNHVTSHAYIVDLSPNTIKLLRDVKPGTTIQFKARVHQYDKVQKKFGFDHMCHVVPFK